MTDQNLSCLITRRSLMLGVAAFGGISGVKAAPPLSHQMQVWKDPNCGCCKDWVGTVEKSGFRVTVLDQGNNTVRARLGMPHKYASCQTATVNGYVIEGHVPVADILRLLKERPAVLGLAVTGMPIGSPGMDGPTYGGRRDAFQVLLVQKDGSAQTFTNYS